MLQQQQTPGRRFGTSKMHLSPLVALAAVRSKAVVLLLLIRCWLLLTLCDSVIVLCFVVRYFVSILLLQSSQLGREGWLLCFVFVFLVSNDCCVALPHDAMGFVIMVFPDHIHYFVMNQVSSWVGWFESQFVGNSEDRVSCVTAHMYEVVRAGIFHCIVRLLALVLLC